MSRYLGVFCVIACSVLLSGCWTNYVAQPLVLKQAGQVAEQLKRAGQGQTHVAVRVRPVDPRDPNADPLPPRYVRLSALKAEESSPPKRWQVFSRNRGGWLTAGSIVLGVGVVSIIGGAVGLYAGLHPQCHGGDSCFGQTFFAMLLGISGVTAGIVETIPGVILLGLGSRQVEVPSGAPGVVYVPEVPVPGGSGALPAGPLALRAGLRF